jgi:hypothetical protein
LAAIAGLPLRSTTTERLEKVGLSTVKKFDNRLFTPFEISTGLGAVRDIFGP